VLAAQRRIEARGANETAHRTRERIAQVFRYAIATGRAKHNPFGDMRGALASVARTSRAAITVTAQVGDLLRAIDGYTRCALRLAPLSFAPRRAAEHGMEGTRPERSRVAYPSRQDVDARGVHRAAGAQGCGHPA
jgi:integrase